MRPDDGIVAPVVAATLMPGGKTCGEHGAIIGDRKLLKPAEERGSPNEPWCRLDERNLRVGVERSSEMQDSVGRHDAVGIQNDEALISAAEALHPIGNITGFLSKVL